MLSVYNTTRAIYSKNSFIKYMHNSSFSLLGNLILAKGGAIHFYNGIMVIHDTVFEQNIAQNGGAIFISCDTYESCDKIEIHHSQFIENRGVIQGGAMYYDFKRPELINNTYINNTAEYGPEIASYAVRIVEINQINQNIQIINAGSGLTLKESPAAENIAYLNLTVVDYDNQTMILENSNKISILPLDIGASVIGTYTAKTINGIASFETIGFEYSPGAKNIRYKASSPQIDDNKISYLQLPTDNSINVSFRHCQPGEIIYQTNKCQV